MKIVLINGSHRTAGNCAGFISKAQNILTHNGHSVHAFDLIQMNIQPCTGCLACEDGAQCSLYDDFSTHIEPALKKADLIVMATPTYFNMPSSSMINFLDRTNKMCTFFSEHPKKCLFYLSGQTDSESIMDAYRCMRTYSDIMSMDEITEPLIQVARMPEQLPNHILDMLNNI